MNRPPLIKFLSAALSGKLEFWNDTIIKIQIDIWNNSLFFSRHMTLRYIHYTTVAVKSFPDP